MGADLWRVSLLLLALSFGGLLGCGGAASAPSPSTPTPTVVAKPPATPSPAPATPLPVATKPSAVATPVPPAPTATVRPPVTPTTAPRSAGTPSPTASQPAATQPAAPTISITNLTPAPNSTVPGGEPIIIAANIISSVPIGAVTVFLDGARIDVEGGGQSETRQAFFTSRVLSPGTHTVRAIATGQGAGRAEAQWSFTVVPATGTPGSTR